MWVCGWLTKEYHQPLITIENGYLRWKGVFTSLQSSQIKNVHHTRVLLVLKVKLKVLVTQLCQTLCSPMDCSPPGSSVHGILLQDHCSGLLFPSPGVFLNPGIEPMSLALQTDSLSSEPPGKILLIAHKLSYFSISLFPLMLIYTYL